MIKEELTGAKLPDLDLVSPYNLVGISCSPQSLSLCVNESMMVLGMEARSSYMLGKCFTTKIYP